MQAFLHWGVGATLIAAILFGGSATADQTSPVKKVTLGTKYKLSGPYQCKNLSVFLIHGKSGIKGKHFISLAEALDKGVVTIDETGDVNHLSATNHSDTHSVFIQSGDIVKGGRQDRTLSQDAILAPKSRKIELDAFCVEQGRWRKRGKESVAKFSSSKKGLSSKQLKLAAKKAKSQEAVWKAVAQEQEQLSLQIGKSVRKDASATSLQLSLEDADVVKKSLEYQQALLPIAKREKDVTGFAFATNGKFNTADIYGDPALFQELWPKLIETAAFEAISSYDEKTANIIAKIQDVQSYLLDAFGSRKKKERSSQTTQRLSGETRYNYAFETKDEKDQTIHINVIKK